MEPAVYVAAIALLFTMLFGIFGVYSRYGTLWPSAASVIIRGVLGMAAIGSVVAGVCGAAHDVQSALTVVGGFIGLWLAWSDIQRQA